MAEESRADPEDESRLRRLLGSLRDILRGIFHSRHLYRPPEE